MDSCFVIQPFDRGKFDKRYEEIFKPAIVAANLKPYRVDEDPTVRIPIEDIEDGIRSAAICFAEITTDNPNVWYELGFAFASNRDVVMVSSDERLPSPNSFPFDIRHKNVIMYKTGSIGDYTELSRRITDRLKAYKQKKDRVRRIIETPVRESKGLKQHELAMLIVIFSQQTIPNDAVYISHIQNGMYKAGFNDVAINLAIRELKRKNMIEIQKDFHPYDNCEYTTITLSDTGEEWILDNQEKIDISTPATSATDSDSDLPI